MPLRTLALACCLLLPSAPLGALPIYQVQGIAPAGFASTATAISSAGAVAGNYLATDGSWQSFVYLNGQTSLLPLASGNFQNLASAINSQGTVAGTAYSSSGDVQATFWSNLNVPLALGNGYNLALNDSGDAAGMRILPDGSGQAFLHRGGTSTSVQGLSQSFSAIYGLNNAGAAAGYAMSPAGTMQAFQLDPTGNVTWLSPLGGVNSYAMAINAAGTVAGHAQSASGALQAVTWANGTVSPLGSLGGVNSAAYALNSFGDVVGFSDLPGSAGTAAFLFYDGILADLNSLIDPSSGWRLLAAYGINDSGQIVGRGLFQGVEQAFLLNPLQPAAFAATEAYSIQNPEPATIYMFFAGIGLVLLARIGRKS